MRSRRAGKNALRHMCAGCERLRHAEVGRRSCDTQVDTAREATAASPQEPSLPALPTFAEALADTRRHVEAIVWYEAQADVMDARHLGALARLLGYLDECLEAECPVDESYAAGTAAGARGE